MLRLLPMIELIDRLRSTWESASSCALSEYDLVRARCLDVEPTGLDRNPLH